MVTFGDGTTENQLNVRRRGLRSFEPGTQATLLTLVQLSRSRPVQVFDVGAHIGMHTLVVSAVYRYADVRVVSFEPTPESAATCRALTELNRFPVRVEECALSDRDGTAEMYISPWETSNSLVEGFRPAKSTQTVRTVRLDTFCAENALAPDVIKIDVETYEEHVLAGAETTLLRARPAIVCEILDGRGALRHANSHCLRRTARSHRASVPSGPRPWSCSLRVRWF